MAYKPILTKATLPPGATGLQNLGNTCFMNSAVQCLSHTVPLTSYFLTDHWKSNLNDTNPLGMKGEIAKVWASVVEHLWRCSEYRQPVFAPRDFKFKMGELIPTFHGYGQQDSHELLQTLLDGLHEDVNRILKKEYVEDPEKGDMTEENFAKVSWECYLKRNNSIIVDIFQAQLKNRTECQVCHNESIKFDPYMYLQLPIPEAEFICRELIAVGAAPWLLPTRTAVKIPRRSTVADLKIAVALQLGWSENAKRDSSFSHCVELFNMKIHLIINDDFSVAHIPASDIICIYELDELHPDILSLGNIVKSAPSELTKVAVCLTDFDETQSMYHTSRPFAPPLLLTFPSLIVLHEPIPEDSKDSAMGQIAYRLIVSKLERYSKMPMYRKLGSKFEYSLDGNEKDADELVWAADQDAEPIPGMFKVKIKIGYQLSEIYPKVKLSTASQKVVHDTSELPFPQPAPKSPVSEFSDLANNMDEKLICGITSIAELSREFQFPNNAELVTEFDSTFKEGFFGAKNSSGVPAKFEPLSDQTVNDMLAEPEHRSITLEQCISEFNKTEMLDGADTMYCSKCKDHQPTKKCLSVYSTPDIFIIQLKRFSTQGRYLSKINGLVHAPIVGLDVTQLKNHQSLNSNDESSLYDLFAVSNHFGGLGGGHSYCLNASDGNWYDCDDSRISLIDQNTVMTPAAYLLFYQRRTSKTTDFQNILEMVRQREAALKEQADLDAEAQGSQTTIDIGTPPVADAETIFANQSAIA